MSIATLKLNNIDRASNLDWIYTNWELGTARNYEPSSLVATSYRDAINKHSIAFTWILFQVRDTMLEHKLLLIKEHMSGVILRAGYIRPMRMLKY